MSSPGFVATAARPDFSHALDQNTMLPVTPQRISRVQKQIRAVSSPLTPSNFTLFASPFTPVTNTYSSPASADTPNSSVSSGTKVDISPTILKFKNASVADAADNWRERASEHGIKVSASMDAEGSTAESIPTSFLSTHRRSRQAQFQSKTSDITAFTTPMAPRISVTEAEMIATPSPVKSLSSLNTPSPRSSSAIVAKLRAQGSLTDPVNPRKRAVFGTNGVALFDIDEHTAGPLSEATLLDSPFPLIRSSRLRATSDSCTQRISFQQLNDSYISSANSTGFYSAQAFCSMCSSASNMASLSFLLPCKHVVCKPCLASILGLVGGGEVQCNVCACTITDFKPCSPLTLQSTIEGQRRKQDEDAAALLPSAFSSIQLDSNDEAAGVFDGMSDFHSSRVADGCSIPHESLAVLRVDNVPWDVTPPALCEFFKPSTVIHAHVLLDPKGKTLSHAFVELPLAEAKEAILNVRDKQLGKGRRIRGVTVTLVSQVELMRSLFPSWKGSFDGCKPTLQGVDSSLVMHTLETGLVNLNELEALVTLMRKPDSHFLKVPVLPFYSLTSMLIKFPADVDGKISWSPTLRDLLYDMSHAAIQMLLTRNGQSDIDQDVLERLVRAGGACAVFSEAQRHKILSHVESYFATTISAPPSISESNSTHSIYSERALDGEAAQLGRSLVQDTRTPMIQYNQEAQYYHAAYGQAGQQEPMLGSLNRGPIHPVLQDVTSFDSLALEFGVDAELVRALAQRLAGVPLPSPAMGDQHIYQRYRGQ